MKKNVLVFGLIGGAWLTIMMVYTIYLCYTRDDFEGNMLMGFAGMILAFALSFVGVKNYRDKYNGGNITFWKAFKIGMFIALIASTMYTVTWLIGYYIFIPDFMDKYVAHTINIAASKGATAAELAELTDKMAKYKEMYKYPIMVVLLTYMEVLPLGLLVSLIAAFILKRKRNQQDTINDINNIVATN